MTTPPPKIDLRNPIVAGILAFLLPGAGHLYQRRFFKAFVFAFGIWGSWWTGMAMSDWKALQAPNQENMQTATVLKFAGQAGVGLPSLWAVYQSKRYYAKENTSPITIPGPEEYAFHGRVNMRAENADQGGDVTGTLTLVPAKGDFGPAIGGKFSGSLDGKPLSFNLANKVNLEQPIQAKRELAVTASVVDENGEYLGELLGKVPRPLMNWFACPLDQKEEAEWHRDRGKYQELAMVFVWVAGLMNLLAIWDAVEGPAYGYYDDENAPAPPPPAA